MNQLKSSVLIIGHPHQSEILFGADFMDDIPEKIEEWELQSFNVVALKITKENCHNILDFFKLFKAKRPHAQKILIIESQPFDCEQQLINSGNVFRMLEDFSNPLFEESVLLALEEASRLQQRFDLQEMATQQNLRLRALTGQLEAMVARREKNLKRSKKRLLTTTIKVQALHRALMAIHNANSVGEMGGLLTEALSEYLDLEWTRIFFSSASSLNSASAENQIATFSVPLLIETRHIGEIAFARSQKIAFTKEQMEFLNQIAEGVALAIDRLTKHDQAEDLKQQWEATFDAISDPLCLVNNEFQILRSNRAFVQTTESTYNSLVSKNCFSVFFGTEHPKRLPEIVDNFEFKTVREGHGVQNTFLVNCQTPNIDQSSPPIRLILFRDITDELRMERQILESAKMAEIGTIGSSIAHELNNPLGGMTSFLQLIKMDCSSDDPIYNDIIEMENAAQKCKEIIENLLGFSRRSDASEVKTLDLREVIQQSIKITELQTRSRGIHTKLSLPDQPVEIKGIFNLLSQSMCNLLQNSYDAIYEIIKNNPRYEGLIAIQLTEKKNIVSIEITDNGIGISPETIPQVINPLFSTKNPETHSGLGLTVAQKIINEHFGTLQLSSQPNRGTTANISFNRPDSST